MTDEVKGTKPLSGASINLAAAMMALAVPPRSQRMPASEMSPLADPRYASSENYKQKDSRLTNFQKKRNKAKKAARKARRKNRGY